MPTLKSPLTSVWSRPRSPNAINNRNDALWRGKTPRYSLRDRLLTSLFGRQVYTPYEDLGFVWTVQPQTGEKAWATAPMPEETEESVRALVDDLWKSHRQGAAGPLGISGDTQ